MPPPPAVGLKDFVTWGLTALALYWNYYNFAYARRLRRDTFELEEWKLERTELRRVTRAFDDEVDLFLSLAKGAHPLDELLTDLAERGRSIALAHGKLVREVERSTALQIAIGTAYGLVADGESSWDRLNEGLAEAAVEGDASAIRARLSGIANTAREISRAIDESVTHSKKQVEAR